MAVTSLLKTATTSEAPLDGSMGSAAKPAISDFLTIQSFTNFAAMTGAITAAWHALERLTPQAAAIGVPYLFAFAWAVISVLMSLDGLRKTKDGKETLEPGTLAGAIFIAAINSLVLAGAVVGTRVSTGGAQ